jgi:Raf kinase inhibitor-like YbhB/YbcL family protein
MERRPSIRRKTKREVFMEFKLSSPAFNDGGQIPSRYTCDGDNINPHLVIHGTPPAAKSLALIVDDPDAPGGTWVHWIVWNMEPETREIREGSTGGPKTGEGTNSWVEKGYGGPCPPSGTHRYFFRLHALDMKLPLEEGATRGELERAMEGHILAVAELMGTYMRTAEGPL